MISGIILEENNVHLSDEREAILFYFFRSERCTGNGSISILYATPKTIAFYVLLPNGNPKFQYGIDSWKNRGSKISCNCPFKRTTKIYTAHAPATCKNEISYIFSHTQLVPLSSSTLKLSTQFSKLGLGPSDALLQIEKVFPLGKTFN
jgi:hypothetical protein